jgi:hypothetical protein
MTKTEQSKKTRAIQPKPEFKTIKAGTTRGKILTALCEGATREQIAGLCLKKDGTPWGESAINAACKSFWVARGFYVTKSESGQFELTLPNGVKPSDVIK